MLRKMLIRCIDLKHRDQILLNHHNSFVLFIFSLPSHCAIEDVAPGDKKMVEQILEPLDISVKLVCVGDQFGPIIAWSPIAPMPWSSRTHHPKIGWICLRSTILPWRVAILVFEATSGKIRAVLAQW